ncbi:hypothetical protein NKR23_g1271 [Pleurostoma richardsiae]|uniref:Uncharacterized protein n=1 Tax=Pleurostoma richardsiae TaxID=41990 RepID=A0AA38SD06_9PEZI|nr:hypothetical protein NKR23_g1271 [Pleurostoma richardsiae]
MPAMYTITEPHPTVPKNTYTHSGRGGAGNTFRVSATSPPAGVPTRVVSNTPSAAASYQSTGRFYSGRGGAGNAHPAADRPVLSFDEEYARGVREQVSTTGHVGRGGAGNTFGAPPKQHRKQSNASVASGSSELARTESASSTGSVRSGFWGRLSIGSLGHR